VFERCFDGRRLLDGGVCNTEVEAPSQETAKARAVGSAAVSWEGVDCVFVLKLTNVSVKPPIVVNGTLLWLPRQGVGFSVW
jgi:hypothetical protein